MGIADMGPARLAASSGAAGAAPVGFPAEVARARVDSARFANLLPAFSKEVCGAAAPVTHDPVYTTPSLCVCPCRGRSAGGTRSS